MFGISQRIKNITPSPTLTLDTKIKEMRIKGEKIINLSVGEPDFDTPLKAAQRAIGGINNGFTKYTNTSGIIELRQALVSKFKNDNNLNYDTDQIMVSVGGKHSLYNAFMTLCNPGDEVILPVPYWVSYPEQIKLAGAAPVIIETDESSGFKLTPAILEKAITKKTKCLLLNSPSNPSGAVYSKTELSELAKVLAKYEFYIISDEIYEKLTYRNAHISIANISEEMKNRTLIVNGFSKSAGMTGWRIGYMAGPKDIIEMMAAFQGHVTSNITSIAQLAAIGALEDFDPALIGKFEERLEYVYNSINKMKYVSCLKPDGAFYVFPNVKSCIGKTYLNEKIKNTEHLCEMILENVKVGIVPGIGFGAPDNVRISYALHMDKLKEAMRYLHGFFEKVK